MIPKLIRHAARIAAVLVLALGAVIAVLAATDRPAEDDANHPSNAAAEQQAEADEALEAAREHHMNYIVATAGADVATKAEALAEYAVDKAAGLDVLQEEADEAAAMNTNPTSVDVPSSCGEYSGNRATGCAITLDRGFDLEQFACLEALWSKESGWNELAANSIGAYGIPQAYPGSKMSAEGDDWRTNPVTQIIWGLGYIERIYGTPCDAWAQSEAEGFY